MYQCKHVNVNRYIYSPKNKSITSKATELGTTILTQRRKELQEKKKKHKSKETDLSNSSSLDGKCNL